VKKKRFSVEQITSVLQQVASGVPVGDVCRQVGISEQRFYGWKKVYGGMLPSEARELKQLREENGAAEARRRRSDLGQGHAPGRRAKKVLKPVKQREVVHYLMGRYEVSERRAVRAARFCLSSIRFRFGYRRLLVLLRREGWEVGKKALLSTLH
jgi:putative transposase